MKLSLFSGLLIVFNHSLSVAQFFQFKELPVSHQFAETEYSYVYKNIKTKFHFFNNRLEELKIIAADTTSKKEILLPIKNSLCRITPLLKKRISYNFYSKGIAQNKINEYECLIYRNYIPGLSLVFFQNKNLELDYEIINALHEDKWIDSFEKEFHNTKTQNINCNNWSTYYGGNNNDEVKGITHDNAGNIYLTGITQSDNFSILPGIISDTLTGSQDAFVIKMDSCGNRIWATYLGSTQFDSGEKIITTENNSITMCGYTLGTDFPITTGCYQDTSKGSYDTFITKLDSSGNIIWSTYFGGTNADFAYDLASDLNNNLFIGGSSLSVDLPTTASSFQQNKSGAIDAYVLKLSANGQLKWCTYYGGSGTEDVHAITCDDSKNVVLVGGTFSSNLNISAFPFQSINNGGMDVYMLKLDSLGNRVFSTYIGGSGVDDTYGIVCGANDDIFFTGNTTSTDFPVTTGCYQNTIAGGTDIYVAHFTPYGAQVWTTYLGGTDIEETRGIVIENNELVLLGRTNSSNIPIIGVPNQANLNGTNFDVYIAKFSLNGIPFWSSYFGGSNEEISSDITNIGSNFFFCGSTYSTDYPVSFGAFQITAEAFGDGFISRLQISHSLTGIQNNEEANQLKIFPNPSSDHFYLKLNDQGINEVRIIDATGNCIYEKTFLNEVGIVKIASLNLESGIYFVEVISSMKVSRAKIIVSH